MIAEKFREYEVQKREDGSLIELGRGSMGVTYKAFDSLLHRHVALRIISPQAMANPEAEARFIREARAAARLRHPNIATVYCLGRTPDDAHYYAMELCEGETIEQLVTQEGRLDWRWSLEIATQAANALAAAARENLTHHDIKPSNLVLVRSDEREALKVVEFGLVDLRADESEDGASVARASIETLYFASPERIQNGILDTRSDIYSLGATLWHMLSGAPPFMGSIEDVVSGHLTGEPGSWRLKHVPEKVVALIRRMLRKSVEDRPQTARELLELIKECLQRPADAQPAPIAEPTPAADPEPNAKLAPDVEPALSATPEPNEEPATPVEPAPNAQPAKDAPPALDERLAPVRWTPSLLDLEHTRRRLEPAEALLMGDALAAILDREDPAGDSHSVLSTQGVSIHFHDPLSESDARAKLHQAVAAWPPFDLAIGGSGDVAEAESAASGARERASTDSDAPGDRVQQLGLLLYELLGGVADLQRAPLTNLGVKGDEALRRAIVDGRAEYPRAADLIGALRAATTDHHAPLPAPYQKPAPSPEKAEVFRVKKGAAVIATVAAGVVVLTLFVVAGWNKSRHPGSSPASAGDSGLTSIPKATSTPNPVKEEAPPVAKVDREKREPNPGVEPLANGTAEASAGIPAKTGKISASTPKPDDTVAAGRFEDLVAQGKTLRESGDTNTALARFRDASEMNPQSPIPIAELAMSYEKMGLDEKAGEQWRHIHDMGEAVGIYFALAEARLKAPLKEAVKNNMPVVVLSEKPGGDGSRAEIVGKQDFLQNSLGMRFVDAGTDGVSFCIWQTRVRDFEAYAKASNLKSNAWRAPGFSQTPDHPVVNVTWREAIAFCKWLTDKEHKEGALPANRFYRLPTDLEWSRAAGLPEEPEKTPSERDMRIADVYPWGKDWPPPPGAGNYNGEETDSDMAIKGYNDGFGWTSPVGSFKPNKFGIYDMGGNVWQWCMDSWSDKSTDKVLRGASWVNGSLKLSLLSSCRVHAAPDGSTDNYGFRIVEATDGER